jgi:hypothetical protein
LSPRDFSTRISREPPKAELGQSRCWSIAQVTNTRPEPPATRLTNSKSIPVLRVLFRDTPSTGSVELDGSCRVDTAAQMWTTPVC